VIKKAALGLALVGALVAGCSSSAGQPGAARQPGAGGPSALADSARTAKVLRLGYILNIPDLTALVGLHLGYFGENLGTTQLQPIAFPSTATEVEALEKGQIDAAYIDPVAAVQAWETAPHGLVKIIAGAASGGSEFVVSKRISSPAQLKGKELAAPAGTAQAAALDQWLAGQNLPKLAPAEATASTDDAVLHEFTSGQIAGAWEPAPLDAELQQAGGLVLVSGTSLWPHGQYAATVLAVTRQFQTSSPGSVTALLKGQIQATRFLTTDRDSAAAILDQQLATQGSSIPRPLLDTALAQMTFTNDPYAPTVIAQARQAQSAGMIKPAMDLASIFDLSELDTLLRASGLKPVAS
jgi:NitT/TauT family transport system substrate-binding protein